MRRTIVLILVLTLPSLGKGGGPQGEAKRWLREAARAMGGEARLRGLKGLQLKGSSHTFLLEQSERPEGPWIVSYEEVTELRDLEGRRLRRTVVSGNPNSFPEMTLIQADGIAATTATFNGQAGPVRTAPADDEWMVLGPERVLLSALDATDLRAESDVVLQAVPHHVVAWSWGKFPVRLFLNANTGLPTAVESVRPHPYDTFWSVWGDVTSRVYFSYWTLEPGGIHYPRQWDLVRNGVSYKSFTVAELTFNPPLPADSFALPATAREAFEARGKLTVNERPLGRPDNPAQELAPGVVLIPGSWNVTLVRQADGVVVLEAPISSGYSAKVIAEAERRFPGVPVKAVVTTSDSWPHIGGLREYVARGIPVYALDLNRPILERLTSAPHTLEPDALARKPRQPKWHIVSGKTVVGDGANRIELYPIGGESSERMMMAYLPGQRLLYGSDLVQGAQADGTFFMPQYLSELMEAVSRKQLEPGNVFAMHTGVTPWAKVTAAVAKASEESKFE